LGYVDASDPGKIPPGRGLVHAPGAGARQSLSRVRIAKKLRRGVMSKLPLSRFKVIDLTRVRAGPTAVRQLADWGADVIKVESTAGDGGLGGARLGPDFQNLHRNKRSICLDLKSPEGLEILKRLVAQADVLVENYRPDVKHRLGIDYESLKAINKRLVYASISGFGQDGPYRDRPGFDQIAQGMGGLMSITGLPGQGPVRVGIPVADLTAGIFAAMGVLVALLEREESGEGQWVQSSLLGAQIAMLDFQAARWLVAKEVPGQAGNDHPTSIPTGVFRTTDGHINIAAAGDDIYRRFCAALGAERLATDPDYATDKLRSKNRARLNAAIEAVTVTKSSAEWIDILNRAGVPTGPIYRIDEVFADPQVRHLGIAQAVEHPKLGRIELVGQAVTLSRTPSKLRTATPEHGQHTDQVLRDLGYDEAAIAGFRARRVI
jgi:crotonobetainyl-CoA:carnitine CoA-transferase CaiB-like acyl-CoA transferase